MREETEQRPTAQQDPSDWIVRPDPDLEDLIPDFLQNRRTDLQDLEAALERGDYVFIKRQGHTLKGICRPYGFIHLESVGRALEMVGERQDAQGVRQLLDDMKRYLDNVRVVYDSEL